MYTNGVCRCNVIEVFIGCTDTIVIPVDTFNHALHLIIVSHLASELCL